MPKLSDKRKPEWLKIKVPGDEGYRIIKHLLKNYDLHTVCEEAMCPNVEECWRQKTATFMILGNICTRNCRFCGIQKGIPLPPDLEEPTHLAEAVEALGLHYVVITSVDRDDLSDGGAVHWAESIKKIRELCPDCRIEILIPDFKGDTSLLDTVLEAEPHVVGHNLETVPSLYFLARPKGNYNLSLKVLKYISEKGFHTKTGIMVGLGENPKEVVTLMKNAYKNGVSSFTLGQYLQPSVRQLPVKEYITPAQFENYKKIGISIGFAHVESGPLVRSSYHAKEQILFGKQGTL